MYKLLVVASPWLVLASPCNKWLGHSGPPGPRARAPAKVAKDSNEFAMDKQSENWRGKFKGSNMAWRRISSDLQWIGMDEDKE